MRVRARVGVGQGSGLKAGVVRGLHGVMARGLRIEGWVRVVGLALGLGLA